MSSDLEILLVAFCPNNKSLPDIEDLLAAAQKLLALRPGKATLLLVGRDVTALAEAVALNEGIDAVALDCPDLENYTNEAFRRLLVAEIMRLAPSVIATLHNSQGWEWAPAVAAGLDAACISAVDGVLEKEGRLYFQKDLYGGKVKGHFCGQRPQTVITIQPGCFTYERPDVVGSGRVTHRQRSLALQDTSYLGVRKASSDTSSVTDAHVVVAVGNGLGSDEHLPLVEAFAKLFDRSAVAGTRIVCDRGWLGYHQQVGVTGATVAPALYFACGISGAVQHVMGMRGSGLVVAINTDARAPMLAESDVCVVEDFIQFLPVVMEVYAQQKAKN